MGLSDIRNRQWSIKETTATEGAGLFDGFDWYVAASFVRNMSNDVPLSHRRLTFRTDNVLIMRAGS